MVAMDYYAGMGRMPVEWSRPDRRLTGRSMVRQEPVGVVGAIVAWNVPLFLAVNKLAPALLAGCTVVLKPVAGDPADAYLLAEVARRPGCPRACCQRRPGRPREQRAPAATPGVDKISFTGVRRRRQADRRACAADLLKPCTLELGGKSAAVVLDDADLDAAVRPHRLTALMNNGQACIAQTRILAPRSRYNEVVDALARRSAPSRSGPRSDAATEIGPLVAERQRDRVLGYIEKGKDRAPAWSPAAAVPTDQDSGWFVQPTVFADVDNHMTIAQEEIFGPVLSVIPYDDRGRRRPHRQRLLLRTGRQRLDHRRRQGHRSLREDSHGHLRDQLVRVRSRLPVRRLQELGDRPRERARGHRAFLPTQERATADGLHHRVAGERCDKAFAVISSRQRWRC